MTESQKLTELPAVARNIHLKCKKCDIERFHVVIAHTSSTSAKVKCEVCGASSTFKLSTKSGSSASGSSASKASKSSKSAGSSAGGKKKSAKRAEADAAALWSELKEQIGTDRVQPYSMKVKFALANAIEHPKFGVGFVTAATNDKIDVVFQEGGRSLVHNRT